MSSTLVPTVTLAFWFLAGPDRPEGDAMCAWFHVDRRLVNPIEWTGDNTATEPDQCIVSYVIDRLELTDSVPTIVVTLAVN